MTKKSTITIATLNLLNDMRRWEERRDLIVDGFKHAKPDLIALQEVVLPENTAAWLATQLGGYSVHLTPKMGARAGKKEALAILSRLPIQQFASQALGAQNRVAQIAMVHAHGQTLLIANGHLYWSVHDSAARLRQVRVLQAWVHGWQKQHPEAGVVVCGDFNGTPQSRAIKQMRNVFRSAHALKHGAEPAWTCPTPLQFSTQPWRKTVMQLAGMAKDRKRDTYWKSTLDYIFVSEQVRVHDCHVAFAQHAPNDPTLYASDHLGLVARVTM